VAAPKVFILISTSRNILLFPACESCVSLGLIRQGFLYSAESGLYPVKVCVRLSWLVESKAESRVLACLIYPGSSPLYEGRFLSCLFPTGLGSGTLGGSGILTGSSSLVRSAHIVLRVGVLYGSVCISISSLVCCREILLS
jgi:hypothetical protein